jgi:flavin-dependent dehydrogenase
MNNLIENIVIVGGGTSGWMSASYLKKSFPDINITVIEAPTIPRIGVGEATTPNLHTAFWKHLGIDEKIWMKRINATFLEMGIKFVNWSKNPNPEIEDSYYHLFGVLSNHNGLPLSHYWAYRRLIEGNNERFDYSCYPEPIIADAKASPRNLSGIKKGNYAWHFDAKLMAEYLKEISISWGVSLIPEHVISAKKDMNGMINSVLTSEGNEIKGDLFIDCTGFRSTLIGGFMEEPFIDYSQSLLCNGAVATQLPSSDDQNGINPFTISTAMNAGWSWKIPLLGRYGAGYVYSDKFQSEDQSIEEFSKFLNIDPMKQNWNRIKFKVGRRRRAWVKNCVGIGISTNFLEPLESTAIYLTFAAIYQLAKFFPDKNCDERLIKQFNTEVNYSYDDCKDFVQIHYITTKRNDTAFWRANQFDLVVSDSLKEKLAMYKVGLPINHINSDSNAYYNNFDLEFRNFWNDTSYYSVLTGMGIYPEKVNNKILYNKMSIDEAYQQFQMIKDKSSKLIDNLPSHYEYLKNFHMNDKKVFKMMEL